MEGGRALGRPDRPNRRPQRFPAGVPALVAVEHRVRREQRNIGVGVASGSRIVCAVDDIEYGQSVGSGKAHGRSQRATRSRMSAGKTLFGMTACTALGGTEV